MRFIAGHPSPRAEISEAYLGAVLEGLRLEGSSRFKPPCESSDLVNNQSALCNHGSLWSQYAQQSIIPPGFEGIKELKIDDNFHKLLSGGMRS